MKIAAGLKAKTKSAEEISTLKNGKKTHEENERKRGQRRRKRPQQRYKMMENLS